MSAFDVITPYRRAMTSSRLQSDWDIFCNVIDNFGDIGVCWRLARQLANEHGASVRLWVDDLASFRPLCPELDVACDAQTVSTGPLRKACSSVESVGRRTPSSLLQSGRPPNSSASQPTVPAASASCSVRETRGRMRFTSA